MTAALARIPQACGIAAGQEIDRVILRSLFMPLFWGASLASLALAVIGLRRWGEPGAAAMLGGLLFVVGQFALTLARNVPLNGELEAVLPARPGAGPVRARDLNDWTQGNHVRTIASATASGLYVLSRVQGG